MPTFVRNLSCHAVAFSVLGTLIAAVSVHDTLLIVVNHDVIGAVEQNPVGRWLLKLQHGEIWLFVTVKLVTTALVCTVLITLYERWRRAGLVTAAAIAGFQATLLGYLTFM